MGEDINILEEMCNEIINEDSCNLFETLSPYEIALKIKNLIKRYRELEYKYDKALTDLSIEAKRTNEENYRCSLFAVENNDLKEKLADSISKSKIKEKMEELSEIKYKEEKCEKINNMYYKMIKQYDYEIAQFTILVLQELMED